MKTKKRKFIIIVLVVIFAIFALVFGGTWYMFGSQLKAVGTIEKLEDHLYAMEYKGDYGFEDFIDQGGAASDAKMGDYIASFLSHGFWKPQEESMSEHDFACSTITVKDKEDNMIFGRNYDWTDCETMIVHAVPENGYESVSSCCLNFLGFGDGWVPEGMMNKMMSLAAVYVPLDGMNEKGLCVADLMAGDDVETHQDTDKPDLTITSMIRLLLDHAATVDEAIKLLSQYDMNSSIGSAHHLSIADATGRSVAVEYVDNEMFVTETPLLTNHYLTKGEKYSVGSKQSHIRFDKLNQQYLKANGVMDLEEVRDSLKSVSQGTFQNTDEKTQWSIVCSPSDSTVSYYFRENYDKKYSVKLLNKGDWISSPKEQ